MVIPLPPKAEEILTKIITHGILVPYRNAFVYSDHVSLYTQEHLRSAWVQFLQELGTATPYNSDNIEMRFDSFKLTHQESDEFELRLLKAIGKTNNDDM